MTYQKLTITITKIIAITNSNRILKRTDNQPRDASTSTTAIGIINKYFADIQTSVMGDKPLGFWYTVVVIVVQIPEAYSQLSVLAVDLLAGGSSCLPAPVFCLWNA